MSRRSSTSSSSSARVVCLQRRHRAEQPPAPGPGDRVVQAGQVLDRGDQPGQRRVGVRAQLQPLRARGRSDPASRRRAGRAARATGTPAPRPAARPRPRRPARPRRRPGCPGRAGRTRPPWPGRPPAARRSPGSRSATAATSTQVPSSPEAAVSATTRVVASSSSSNCHTGSSPLSRSISARCTAAPAALRGAHPRRHVGHVVQAGHHAPRRRGSRCCPTASASRLQQHRPVGPEHHPARVGPDQVGDRAAGLVLQLAGHASTRGTPRRVRDCGARNAVVIAATT